MIEIRNVSKSFNGFRALGPISLDLGRERVTSFVGPSGCGKSTLLQLLAGLTRPDDGAIAIDGQPMQGPRGDIGVAFQDARLMPWLTVSENVGMGVWDRSRAERHKAVIDALAKVSLTGFAGLLPKQLSGGMAQRAGLARALVAKPRLLLLDEPFSALDPLTRLAMQQQLADIVGAEVSSAILITHDIEEALMLSDRILVLDGPPAIVRRDLHVDLKTPRIRTSRPFQKLRESLLGDLVRLPND
ncbi:ABC transporter ATP-binding protein [Mesorhizobium sp. M0088]|uniref:ABC transporter ATP-binding protein n=1 Tax=Mesorhizobium sp. M0088 TaxID=2956873 RepID=UPI0033369800